MIRTVWFALFCLGGIAALASVKFVSSAFGTRVENPVAQVERASIGLNAKNEELVKADRLTVNVDRASYETTSVIPVKVDPVDVRVPQAVKESIVSRHWHEPNSARFGNFANRVREKKKNKKRKMVSAVRPKEPECSDSPLTILQSLNLSPRCGVASTLATKRTLTAK
jgi:hypothetical protein